MVFCTRGGARGEGWVCSIPPVLYNTTAESGTESRTLNDNLLFHQFYSFFFQLDISLQNLHKMPQKKFPLVELKFYVTSCVCHKVSLAKETLDLFNYFIDGYRHASDLWLDFMAQN